MNDLKEKLFDFCKDFVQGRVVRIQNSIAEIQESLQSETKSSAGDKHETGRAMIQLEREKLGAQLAEAEQMLQVLARIKPVETHKSAALGSLVLTTSGNYFLAVSAGEYKDDDHLNTFCISVATPIGRLLLGKKKGETVNFNSRRIKIKEIL